MKPRLLFALLIGFVASVRAELPDAVVQACLAPSVTEHVSGQTWQLMTATAWERGALRIAETAEATLATQPAAIHPQGWMETEITLVQPHDTAERIATEQTLTLKLKAKGVVPKLEATVIFLNQAKLPPCTIETYQGKLAIVAKAKDWYILAEDPATTVTQTDEAQPRTTMRLQKVALEKLDAAAVSIRVGEGSLP
jgi:hypothetical protein